MGNIMAMYTTLGDRLDRARDRVFAAVVGERAPGDDVEDQTVIPLVLAIMESLCDDGDEAVCELTRAWLWFSAEAALAEFGEAHDLPVLSDGTGRRFTSFVRGGASVVSFD